MRILGSICTLTCFGRNFRRSCERPSAPRACFPSSASEIRPERRRRAVHSDGNTDYYENGSTEIPTIRDTPSEISSVIPTFRCDGSRITDRTISFPWISSGANRSRGIQALSSPWMSLSMNRYLGIQALSFPWISLRANRCLGTQGLSSPWISLSTNRCLGTQTCPSRGQA